MAERIKQSSEDFIELIVSKLRSFKNNYNDGNYRECASALHFICEGLARYVLGTKGYYPESHEGVQILFAQHFVRPGEIKKDAYNHLTNLYLRRKDAEYRGFVAFDKDDITDYFDKTISFYNEVKKYFAKNHALKIQEMINKISKVFSKKPV